MSVVLDTNASIYQFAGILDVPIRQGVFVVSVITRIELLSFPGLKRKDYAVPSKSRSLFSRPSVIPVARGFSLGGRLSRWLKPPATGQIQGLKTQLGRTATLMTT